MGLAIDPLIRGLVRDDAITRGLDDEEARMLIEWLVDWAELLGETAKDNDEAGKLLERLSRRARAIARFVALWTVRTNRPAALQLAAVEQFHWPLPTRSVLPADLMEHILQWEQRRAW